MSARYLPGTFLNTSCYSLFIWNIPIPPLGDGREGNWLARDGRVCKRESRTLNTSNATQRPLSQHFYCKPPKKSGQIRSMPYPINLKQAEKKLRRKNLIFNRNILSIKKHHLFKQSGLHFELFMNFAWKILYVLVVVFPNLWLSGLCSRDTLHASPSVLGEFISI